MSLNAGAMLTWGRGRKTAAAGTTIDMLVRPRNGKRTKLTKVSITNAGTAHTLTVLTPQGVTTLAAAAAAAQAVVVLTNDPGNFSAYQSPAPSTANNLVGVGDYLVFETPGGEFLLAKVHASTAPVTNSDGTVTVTLAAVLPTGGLRSGARCWFLGVAADVDPHRAEAFPIFTVPVSATTTWASEAAGCLCETWGESEPMLLQENNATAAATVEFASGVYGP